MRARLTSVGDDGRCRVQDHVLRRIAELEAATPTAGAPGDDPHWRHELDLARIQLCARFAPTFGFARAKPPRTATAHSLL
jgi:hypothetical protein